MLKKIIIPAALFSLLSSTVLADTITVKMYRVAPSGQGTSIGTVKFTDTKYGMLITPNLYDLSPDIHGFHIHVNPSCANNGDAAGGHLDPQQTNKHLGPYDTTGHLGDLPALTVNKEGKASLPVLAPRLKVSVVVGHALIFHVGGDNYSDYPEKLGGGDGRFACGVAK